MKINEYYPLHDVGKAEVGIEVEMEGTNLPRRREHEIKYWAITTDGSLRGEAYEYVLSQPIQRNEVQSALNSLWRKFNSVGSTLTPSDRCGVHVHINCQPLTIAQVFNMAILYFVMEDLLVKWCGEDREGNLFCLRSRDAEYLIPALIKDKAHGTFTNVASHNAFRYAAINFSSLPKYGSLEFRALRTPAEPGPIQQFVNMLLALKDYSIKVNDPEEYLKAVSGQGAEEFVTSVFGRTLAKQLLCRDADDLILDGARRVQALVYAPFTEITAKKKSPVDRQQEGRRDGRIRFDNVSNTWYDHSAFSTAYTQWMNIRFIDADGNWSPPSPRASDFEVPPPPAQPQGLNLQPEGINPAPDAPFMRELERQEEIARLRRAAQGRPIPPAPRVIGANDDPLNILGGRWAIVFPDAENDEDHV